MRDLEGFNSNFDLKLVGLGDDFLFFYGRLLI